MNDEQTREIDEAEERGRVLLATAPVARSARFDAASGRIVVELTDGRAYAFPPALSQDLAGANAHDISEIAVDGAGLNLSFPRLDADLYVPALIAGVFGTREWMEREYPTHRDRGPSPPTRSKTKKTQRPRKAG